MTQHLTSSAATDRRQGDCEPADRVTKSLLGYGVIAGPFYVVVALAQAVTREGFDLARHQWSLLSNGANGWIQIANFVVTGLMVIAFAVGLRRALEPGRGARWAPRLIGVYGASLIAAGIFRADPALGFPVGAPRAADRDLLARHAALRGRRDRLHLPGHRLLHPRIAGTPRRAGAAGRRSAG